MSDEELIVYLRDGCNLQQRDGERAAARIEALTAERDALKAAQIDAIRAALEAAIEKTALIPERIPADPRFAYHAALDAVEHHIRAIDPAAIVAKLKGEK